MGELVLDVVLLVLELAASLWQPSSVALSTASVDPPTRSRSRNARPDLRSAMASERRPARPRGR